MQEILSALHLEHNTEVINPEYLPSRFAVSKLAASSIGAVGSAISGLVKTIGLRASEPDVFVDQRLASLWFNMSIQPIGWQLPPVWDAVAGDYETQDGWIKLHTNLPHHRRAALSVLGVEADRKKVASAVKNWRANDLETAIVKAGGVAAQMRSRTEWQEHPQGLAVAAEPLIHWVNKRTGSIRNWHGTAARPLNGLRVLDLTRVLAGPVATRTLAAFGAEVLRIDPPEWDEANIVPDITLGKRCSFLNLKEQTDRQTFEQLLANADVLVHGYRSNALENLGYGSSVRTSYAPHLIEVSLDAYGWTGPWAKRRGFDSLVQMSCGIADAGMHWANAQKPTPLPVQALDHATGYMMAAAAIRAIDMAVLEKSLTNARLSLARTAELLMANIQQHGGTLSKDAEERDFSTEVEQTPWGPAQRLKPPLHIEGAPMTWPSPACNLGSVLPNWL
ncbi:CoA transferase [Kordiimonas aquimaris]|uniref:CoA transferase n=1 Tax=Kordiimonas aquimaris TaxID=707591 RepID=UPI0021D06C92|nr:CoA transferase [Kordiimonas aquimaris]